MDQLQHALVLVVADAVDGLGIERIVGRALRQLDAARLEEVPDAVLTRLAVDVLVVVLVRVEGHELAAGRLRALAQELVEGLLPCGGMDLGCLRQHTVEVKEQRVDVGGQAEHSAHSYGSTGVRRHKL